MPSASFKAAIAVAAVIALSTAHAPRAYAEDRTVTNDEELAAALEAAAPGDQVILEPGIYKGGLYRENLSKVIVRSADVQDQAVIEGGGFGLMLSDPVDVVIANLVFANQVDNGINIDDGGSPETPASNITLIGVTVRDMQRAGNHDAIKLAGVKNFVIDGVKIENWGSDGSAIDFVGCHHGLVQNSVIKHDRLEVGGSGIRPKGGSKDIVIRANRIELPRGKGRAIQAGGHTSTEYFRFPEGEADYEASEIFVEGNVIIGGSSAVSWVNIDGGIVHHNAIHSPGTWIMRILTENEGTSIVETRNGQFIGNEIVFNDKGDFNRAVNESDSVAADTFKFARNRWHNLADPTPGGSRPKLPADEEDGIYGEPPVTATDAPQVWEFPWGRWIVNATPDWMPIDIDGFKALRVAIPSQDSKFEPLLDDPLTGEWSALDLMDGTARMQPMSQLVLISRDACARCAED